MKKRITALVMAICFGQIYFASAQKRNAAAKKDTVIDTVGSRTQKHDEQVFGNFILFAGAVLDRDKMLWNTSNYAVSDTALYKVYNMLNFSKHKIDSLQKLYPKAYYAESRPNSSIMLGIKLNPGLRNYQSSGSFKSASKYYPVYRINDNSAADLVAMGINAGNVNDYRYHVVVNDSAEIIPWSVPKLQQNYGAQKKYGFLGNYKGNGKQVIIEVVNIKDYSIRDGIVLDWRSSFKPVVTQITISNKTDFFNLNGSKNNYQYATRFDKDSGLPLDFKFRQDEIETIYIDFKNHETTVYSLYIVKELPGARPDTSFFEQTSDNTYAFNKNKYDKPGKYELLIQPVRAPFKWDATQIAHIKFKVLPSALHAKQFTIKQILPFLIAGLLTVILVFTGYYLFNKRRLRKAAQQKDIANLKLNSVRAQLNPHFMFNALTSIQNLMNQHDQEGTNHYLAKFANLTRQVLKSSGNELISLEDELRIIDDYLQMEKLRFGFNYSIEVDETISRANTEVPAMLLQPFIENAAKHGISALKTNGKIEIVIAKQNNDLIFTITDNGAGFAKAQSGDNGFGLKLSRDRVQLLNQIYKDQHIDLQINNSISGVKINIVLTNWA
ncbi:sensor histidine kinase [Mucilaginibacter pineti]|nr:histidine kinase [Mucilaginibacter pineti]